ncbi:MAG: iron-sulfur cluster assembly protein [Thiovulaceae bacterium]|nr:iron-sulfur cluster assembly protein [Sulfurimonadaceae bacterium]
MTKLERIKEEMIQYYKRIYDPEIPVNIYDLGLIYAIDLGEKDGKVYADVDMTLTSPGCSIADTLIVQVGSADKFVEDLDFIEVNLVFDPPWSQDSISFEAKLELGLL